MTGNIVLDTNILIYLSKKLIKPEKIFEENAVFYISVISKMELLGYAFKNQFEEEFLVYLTNALKVVALDDAIVDTTIALRKNNKIKLPDAIVYATAELLNGKLFTNNIADFDKINGTVILYNPVD